MDEFPGNRQRKPELTSKLPEKKIERIAEGTVRKKSLGKRFAETFVLGDLHSVVNYVVWDVLIPAAKDMASDAVNEGTNRMFYGESRSSRARGGRVTGTPSAGYFNYQGISSAVRRPESRSSAAPLSQKARSTHDFDEIVIESRAQGEEVIDKLFALLETYEEATVSDLYEMCGISSTPADVKWGWTSLSGAGVTRVKGGYLLDLPKPVQLD